MKKLDYYLECLHEECNEVGQRISKAKRFGLEDAQKGQKLNNRERIKYELTDLFVVAQILIEEYPEFCLTGKILEDAYTKKKAKLKKYLEYSRSLGIVE